MKRKLTKEVDVPIRCVWKKYPDEVPSLQPHRHGAMWSNDVLISDGTQVLLGYRTSVKGPNGYTVWKEIGTAESYSVTDFCWWMDVPRPPKPKAKKKKAN